MEKYFKDVVIFREELLKLMDKLGVKYNKCNLLLNPFYGQIIPNSGIAVEFYYGYPYKIYTPLGYLPIWDTHAIGGKETILLETFLSTFGAILIKEKEKTNFGEFGPIYAITKIPNSPNSKYNSSIIFKDLQEYTSYEDAKHLFELYTS